MRKFWVLICLLVLLSLLHAGPRRVRDQPTPESVAAGPAGQNCSPELIRLAEQVLRDGSTREANHERLRELDPSDEMTIAVELMSNDRLRKIVEKEKLKCH